MLRRRGVDLRLNAPSGASLKMGVTLLVRLRLVHPFAHDTPWRRGRRAFPRHPVGRLEFRPRHYGLSRSRAFGAHGATSRPRGGRVSRPGWVG